MTGSHAFSETKEIAHCAGFRSTIYTNLTQNRSLHQYSSVRTSYTLLKKNDDKITGKMVGKKNNRCPIGLVFLLLRWKELDKVGGSRGRTSLELWRHCWGRRKQRRQRRKEIGTKRKKRIGTKSKTSHGSIQFQVGKILMWVWKRLGFSAASGASGTKM